MRNDDLILLHILEKTVDSITPSEHREISNKWISVTFEEGVDYSLLIKVISFGGGVLLLFAYHAFMQTRYVKRLRSANDEIQEKNRLLKTLSNTDTLTGLFNRSKLDEVLGREIGRFKDCRSVFSIVLLDVDDFKGVNDAFGHLEGDRVLKELSALLVSSIRNSDIVGRWGGEEFLVVCPGTSLGNAQVMAEHLRNTVRSWDFRLGTTKTISLGVAQMSGQKSLEDLLSAADKALYAAKNTGRDRVVTA